MAVTVTSAASHYRLADPAAVATALGVTNDAALQAKVTAVSSMFASWCDRVFAKETVTETFPGSGRLRLLLSRRPVISFSAVRLNGVAQTLSDFTLEDRYRGFLFAVDSAFYREWRGSGGIASDPLPEESEHIWQVDYVGGWVLPEDGPATGSDIDLPADIQQAVILQVGWLQQNQAADTGMKSESIGDYSYTRFDQAGGSVEGGGSPFTPAVEAILRPYRVLR